MFKSLLMSLILLGTITMRVAGAGATWAEITLDGGAYGQTLIAAYTVKAGYTAYVGNVYIGVDTGKTIDILAMQRSDTNDLTAPYDGVRRAYTGVANPTSLWINSWRGPFTRVHRYWVSFPWREHARSLG